MKKFASSFIALVIICAAVTALSSCAESSVLYKINASAEDKRVVGSAGGYDVLFDELRCVTANYRDLMEMKYGDGIWDDSVTAEKYRGELEGYVTSALAVNCSALKLAKAYDIAPDDKEVREYITLQLNKLAEDLGDELISLSDSEDYTASEEEINKAYEEYLSENYLTDRYNRYVMSVDGCIEQLRLRFIKDGSLPSDDASNREYIEKNFVRVLNIYIPASAYDNINAARDDAELALWMLNTNLLVEENRAELRAKLGITKEELSNDDTSSAVKFYNRITTAIDKEARMRVLVGSAYNKDTSISQNGYYFTNGEYGKPYETAAFALSEGGISEVVAVDSGYYIIQRLPLEESYITANLDLLTNRFQAAYINSLVEQSAAGVTFSFNAYGGSLDITKIK